jgi:hypothetical protein
MPYSLWKDLDRIAVGITAFDATNYYGGLAIYTDSKYEAEPDVVYAPGTWTHLLKEES